MFLRAYKIYSEISFVKATILLRPRVVGVWEHIYAVNIVSFSSFWCQVIHEKDNLKEASRRQQESGLLSTKWQSEITQKDTETILIQLFVLDNQIWILKKLKHDFNVLIWNHEYLILTLTSYSSIFLRCCSCMCIFR